MRRIALAMLPVITLTACEEALTPVAPEPGPGFLPTGPSFATVSDAVPRQLHGLAPGAEARATGINDDGFVTGWSTVPGGLRAVIWTPTGEIRELDGASALGFRYGMDINNNRQVVGYSQLPDGYHAYFWSETGGAKELETLGGGAAAYGINNNGDVVGQSQVGSTSGPWRAVIWKAPDHKVQDLGTLPGECSSDYGVAFGVNDRRQVVGGRCGRAFVWSETEGMRPLDHLPGALPEFGWGAFAINNAGYVVGGSTTTINGFPAQRAVLWSPSGVPRDLGALPTEHEHIWGPASSVARDINDRGEIVGHSFFRDWKGNQITHGTLWADGEVTDLAPLPGGCDDPRIVDPSHSDAYSINKHGQPVGSSRVVCHGEMATLWGVTYANSAPVANAGGPYSGYEGTPIPFNGSATDPDGDALTFSWAFGDGGTASSAIASHAYSDNGSFTATFTATDPRGLSGSATASVTVSNVAPRITLGSHAAIYSGDTYNLSAPFSDPGMLDAPWETSIDWGDGFREADKTNNQSAPITGARQYFRAATYTIRVTATDKDGGQGESAMTLEVLRIPVTIDVERKDETNTISLKTRGPWLDVVIFTTDTYDARVVDPGSVVITNGSGSGTALREKRKGLDYDYVDVNRDGSDDLVLTFDKREMIANGDLTPETTKLIVLADGSDRRQIRGEDRVEVTP